MSVTEIDPVPSTRLLRQLPFQSYWLARLLGQAAQGAVLYGLLILLAEETTRSIYGAVFVACSIVPSLVFGLVGGWVADLVPERLLLLLLSIARAGIVLLLVRGDPGLTTIFVVALGIWTVHQFFSPAESSILAKIVDPDRLSTATALSSLALTLAQVLGMVILAPLLLKLDEPRVLFLAVAALYAIPAALYLRMGRTVIRAGEGVAKRRPRLALRHGWRVALADRQSFAALIDAVAIGVGLSTLVVIVPPYLERVLDTSADNTVFVFAPAVIGLVAGLQVAPILGRAIGHGRLAAVGLVGFAASIVGLGMIDQVIALLDSARIDLMAVENRLGLSTRIAAAMLISIPAGFFSSLTNVAARTVLLLRSPEDARGQVLATQATLANAIALVPTFLAGALIDLFAVEPVTIAVGALLVAGAIAARRLSDDAPATVTESQGKVTG